MGKLVLRFTSHLWIDDETVTLVEELEDWYIYKTVIADSVDLYNGECFHLDIPHIADVLSSYEATSYSFYIKK